MPLAESFESCLNPSEVNRPRALMAWAAFCQRLLMRKDLSLSVLISLKLRLFVRSTCSSQGWCRQSEAVRRLRWFLMRSLEKTRPFVVTQ